MADLSASFNPSLIALNSDAASSALVAAAGVSDAASDAGSKASVAYAKASVASVAAAAVSDAASNALSVAAVAASKASDASSAVVALKRTVILKLYNEASAIAAGDGKMYFTVPALLNGMNLVSAGGHLYTAATSDIVEIQINNVTSGVDMLTSKLTWDATEKDTATAVSQAVINTAADGVVTGEEIRIDIDSAASGAKGMELRLTFQVP
jgi:hypothetical protein